MIHRGWAAAALALVLSGLATGCSTTHDTPSSVPSGTASIRSTPGSATPSVDQRLRDKVEHGLKDRRARVLGGDVSWPQCPRGMGIPQKRGQGAPMPTAKARFVLVGLTNGPGFTPNPCLADQVAWVSSRKLMVGAYSVVSQPSRAELTRYGTTGPFPDNATGRLSNAGYQEARFNIVTMRRLGLSVPAVWLDVEHVPDFDWGSDRSANAAVVAGAARGYRDAGYRIGIYSTPALWRDVVGDLRLGVPEWRAAGQTSAAEALRRCGDDWRIQGGDAVLAQWVEAGRDRNLTCPGAAADLDAWFHRY